MIKMVSYILKPSYDSRKSFYGKAIVEVQDNKHILYSYNTKVAEIDGETARVFGTYSITTLRHIKEFLLQHGFKVVNKIQIINDYGVD